MLRKLGLLFFVGWCVVVKAETAAPGVVFQIGAFDHSYSEFTSGNPSHPVSYVPGESQSAKDWFWNQPAEFEGQSAADKIAAAPREITFALAKKPASLYRLHIAMLSTSGKVPALRIDINGKRGIFFLHPVLSHEGVIFLNSNEDMEFLFPGSYLRTGQNRISLQAVNPTGVTASRLWLTYDAIGLDEAEQAKNQRPSSAVIEPTIFYPQSPGPLKEEVDAFIRYQEPMKSGTFVELDIAGRKYSQTLRGNQDFGEEQLKFLVDDFPAQTQAQITWSVNGRRERILAPISPQKKWTLFVVPHIHLDIGYTDYQAKVASTQSRVIDQALEMTARHPDFRFALDGYWSFEQFLDTRSPAQVERAITAIQKKELFFPADYANLLTGYPTAETLIRSLYPSANFSRVHGTPFNYATITDVPSYSWSYASILASAGIKDLIGGSDSYRAPVLLQGKLNEASPFWWEGPDGNKVLLWYAYGYGHLRQLFGPASAAEAGYDTLPLFLQQYEHPAYLAKATLLYGSQGENTKLAPAQAEVVGQWNDLYAYPHLQYSGFYEALEDIANQFGTAIPTVRGDGGPYWEDGIAADALYSALERENEHRGPSAEKLSTLSSVVNPLLAANKKALDQMWMNMVLMDEHTWNARLPIDDPTSTEAVEQAAFKEQYALKARDLVDFVARNSMASIIDSIRTEQGALVVFNTLNWTRSGPVSIDLVKGDEIVDKSSGEVMAFEVLHTGNKLFHVSFVAKDVPAVGYKVFELRPAPATPDRSADKKSSPRTPPDAAHAATLESPYYRVALDPASGAVKSIFDKQLKRELVDEHAPYRFGEYLYVTGGDLLGDKTSNGILQYDFAIDKPQLDIHRAQEGQIVSIDRSPDGWVAHMRSSNKNTPEIATEIRLFDSQKKVEITEDVTKQYVTSKEAVYLAFPFAMSQPDFQYDIQNGVVNPAKDMHAGAGQEWFSLQHWIAVEQDGVSATLMPLDAPLVTLGDINRGAWLTHFGPRTGTIFSYLMNNYWLTNFAAGQGGHFHFRYVITSDTSTRPVDLARVGWEEMTPLEKNEVTRFDSAPVRLPALDGTHGSFLSVDDSQVLLETWKPAEDGRGTILRFLDLGGKERTIAVRVPSLHLTRAWQTDAVERDAAPLPLLGTTGFQFKVHPHEIVTVRLLGEGTIQPPPN